MSIRSVIKVPIVALLQILTGCAASSGDIRILDPWASEPAGARANVIAGFMCIQNDRSSSVRITGVSSDATERVEIHEIIHEQGIVRMKKLEGLDVPPNSTVCLEPKSTHFMLIGIADSIHEGSDILLEINTASGNKLHAVLPQRALSNTD